MINYLKNNKDGIRKGKEFKNINYKLYPKCKILMKEKKENFRKLFNRISTNKLKNQNKKL